MRPKAICAWAAWTCAWTASRDQQDVLVRRPMQQRAAHRRPACQVEWRGGWGASQSYRPGRGPTLVYGRPLVDCHSPEVARHVSVAMAASAAQPWRTGSTGRRVQARRRPRFGCILLPIAVSRTPSEAESISIMPAHHAKTPLLVVANARHSQAMAALCA